MRYSNGKHKNDILEKNTRHAKINVILLIFTDVSRATLFCERGQGGNGKTNLQNNMNYLILALFRKRGWRRKYSVVFVKWR